MLANWFVIFKKGMKTHRHDYDAITLFFIKYLGFCSIFAIFQFKFKERDLDAGAVGGCEGHCGFIEFSSTKDDHKMSQSRY